MANKVEGEVWDRYPAGGGELLLALAIADHAHDDGTHIFPGVERLARKTRQSERTVQYQLRKMEASGWLILVNDGKGGRSRGIGMAGRPREYRINPAWMAGEDLPPQGGEGGAPDGVEPHEKGKGANFAPFQKTPVEHSKGANSAPLNRKPYGVEGCKREPQRVQNEASKGATAIAPELKATKSNQEQKPSSSQISDPDTGREEDDVEPRLPPEQIEAELVGLERIPAAIDRELLARFFRHRRVMRRPLSISGWLQLLPRFAELTQQGHDLNESLRQTMAAGLSLPVTPAQRNANGASHATTLRPGHESHADRSARLNGEALARRAAASGSTAGGDRGQGGAGGDPIDVEWTAV
ncbi:hypothetical protein GIY21_00890 [Xanthomonas sontii]|uniref:Helix-turn-helix domain-containing protein n=1 Tax=Xanthomonas sontii TaxID=2650745 RepID=A0A6N7Q3M2_9XANT|nr:hypothetical protein [Xanthomonas sontii]MRH73366.1 hypothetical protein [Xanthomonas sontii]